MNRLIDQAPFQDYVLMIDINSALTLPPWQIAHLSRILQTYCGGGASFIVIGRDISLAQVEVVNQYFYVDWYKAAFSRQVIRLLPTETSIPLAMRTRYLYLYNIVDMRQIIYLSADNNALNDAVALGFQACSLYDIGQPEVMKQIASQKWNRQMNPRPGFRYGSIFNSRVASVASQGEPPLASFLPQTLQDFWAWATNPTQTAKS